MKRLFACLAGIAVGVSLLSGCGSSAKVDSGNSSGKEVRLTFMGWEASPLETESVKNGITKFESQNPNLSLIHI